MYVFQPIFICVSLYGKPISTVLCGLHNDFPSHQVRRVMQARVTGLDPITQFSGLCKRIFPGNPCLHFSCPHSSIPSLCKPAYASQPYASHMYIVCIHISFVSFFRFSYLSFLSFSLFLAHSDLPFSAWPNLPLQMVRTPRL